MIWYNFNRSLLTERESQHSLGSLSSYGSSESEPKSAQSDPGRYTQEKSRFTFTHKDSSGSLGKSVSILLFVEMSNVKDDWQEMELAEDIVLVYFFFMVHEKVKIYVMRAHMHDLIFVSIVDSIL